LLNGRKVLGVAPRQRQLSGELKKMVHTQRFNDSFQEDNQQGRWAGLCHERPFIVQAKIG